MTFWTYPRTLGITLREGQTHPQDLGNQGSFVLIQHVEVVQHVEVGGVDAVHPRPIAMSRGGRGQSSRSLINDFQLQSYGGYAGDAVDAVPLSSGAQNDVPGVEFSDIDLDSDASPAQQAKVVVIVK